MVGNAMKSLLQTIQFSWLMFQLHSVCDGKVRQARSSGCHGLHTHVRN